MSYIKLDRRLLKWEWKDDPYMVALWVEILLQANYEDSRWHGKEYKRGSFPTSIKKLSKATGLTPQRVRTCLDRLKSTHEITYESTSQGTTICVVKWAKYQGSDDGTNTVSNTLSNKRSTNDQQTINNTIRNKEEIKKERSIYNSIPTYDPSKNPIITEEERKHLLELMKGEA